LSINVLVTGAHGFVGRYLIARLQQKGDSVFGVDLSPTQDAKTGSAKNWYSGDIRNADFCINLVNEVKPDLVFHLAGGLNSPILSDLFSTNVQGTLNILEALYQKAPESKMIYISSGAVYGNVPASRQPIMEDEQMNPVTPNGVSKMAADQLCNFYGRTHALNIIRVRPFNLIGPGQSDNLVCAAFARQMAEIRFGLQEKKLQVGNLNSSRDFLDVRDVARGLVLLAESGRPGEAYNLCSGRATRIKDVLDSFINLSGMDVEVSVDPARLQHGDVPAQVGSHAKIRQDTGWEPEISLEKSLQAMWDDWCFRVGNLSENSKQ